MTDDARRPTTETDNPNLSTKHQRDGDARRPSDMLDKGQTDLDGSDKIASVTRRPRGQFNV